MFTATHESGGLVGAGDRSFKTLHDRFLHMNITMPDNIAFELIGHALKVKEFAKSNCKEITGALKERTALPRKAVMEFASVCVEKTLTDILPIHPMTAILLKNLASYFASNQRSIFNFIKNNAPTVKAFQHFIATKSPLNGDLLTIDYLWNFFCESGTYEHGGGVGRMNLNPSIRAILDSYSLITRRRQHISTDGKNLELAFTGVAEMENGCAVAIANNLVRRNILYKRPSKTETFAAMALGGDFAEKERLRKTVAENVRTAELVEGKTIEFE